MVNGSTTDAGQEGALLNEIRGLADDVRGLRTTDARINGAEIRSLEERSRAKWEQLRRLRAGPIDIDRTLARRSFRD